MENAKAQGVQLAEICEIISGQSPPSKDYNKNGEGLPFYQGKADFGERYPSARVWCSKPVKIAEAGDILFCVRAPVGPTNIATEKSCIGRGLAAIRPRDKVDPLYLLHYLRHIEPSFAQLSNGSTFKAITRSDLSTLHIPLPPLPAQRRIAAILDKADALRRKRQQALDLLDDFLQAVFLDMFGDPVTNPKGWEVKRLGEHLDFLTSGSRGWAKYYTHKGDLFLRIQNVGRNELLLDDIAYANAPDSAEARRTRVAPGDVLLSITADLGRTAVVPEGLGTAHINQHLALLRPKGILPLYLSAFLASEGGQRQFNTLNRNGVKAGLNFDDIRGLQILLPDRGAQLKFADIYHKRIRAQDKVLTGVQTANDLFDALVQRAFRGEL